MSIDLEFGTSFQSTPETREERHRASIILSKNGSVETLKNKNVILNYETANFVNFEIDGFSYQVFKKKGEKLLHTMPKYTTEIAYLFPVLMGGLGVSTFYNIQFYFNLQGILTISNTYLLLVIGFLSWFIGYERSNQMEEIMFLKQQYRGFTTIDLGDYIMPQMVREYYKHLGWSTYHLFAAVGFGITLIIPLAFQEFVYTTDYVVSWISAGVCLLVLMGKLTLSTENNEELRQNPPRIYAPQAVEPIFQQIPETTEKGAEIPKFQKKFIGYRNLGILINVKGDNKEERAAFIKKLEKDYKNKKVIGFREVIQTENALETPEISFQAYISEAYREEVDDETDFDVVDVDQAKKVLQMTLRDLQHMDEIKKEIDKIPETNEEIKKLEDETLVENPYIVKTTKEILLWYDKAVRKLQNAVSYLAQELRGRTSANISDKQMITNLEAAYHSVSAHASKPPKIKEDIDMTGIWKAIIYSIAGIGILFIIVWGLERGVL